MTTRTRELAHRLLTEVNMSTGKVTPLRREAAKALEEQEVTNEELAKALNRTAQYAQDVADSLQNLIGFVEIAAVMPEAIGKHMEIAIDCEELNSARETLAKRRISG